MSDRKSCEKQNIKQRDDFFPKMEEIILDFWEKREIFKKSVENPPAGGAPKGDYVFYDGPPFATGMPHYGHIAASIMKDVVPRYWTMKGYRVKRKWGWDCHGLPVENLAEKELGLKNKREIEKIGIEKFNDYCRSIVLRYAEEWKKTIRRVGRWVDMENDYKTMDADFMESIWWAFKTLYGKGLIYKDYKSMHICPRCGTTLSNFEVTQGYKNIKDLSAIAQFELEDEPGTYALAWTTAPWTLIGNAALAVGKNIDYVKIKINKSYYILAKERLEIIKQEYEIAGIFKGKDLVGKKYKPLFDYYSKNDSQAGELKNKENGWKICAADFVTAEEGAGIVHIAPAFGEDDMNLGKENKLPFIQHVNMDGTIKQEAKDFAGMNVKPAEDTQKTDVEIIRYLAHRNMLFHKEKYEHSYPHCWRCDTPLLNYSASSWFVKVADIKENLIANNQKIHWVPEHIKDGRFGKWLEQARDWAISRNRYWGAPLPVWICDKCGKAEVAGSIRDIAEKSGRFARLILLRHGESEKNIKNIFYAADDGCPLTDVGVKQAESAAELLLNEKICKIYASPVERARQTAGIAAEKLGLEVNINKSLREIFSGKWEGKTPDDPAIKKERDEYHDLPVEKNYDAKRGGGESWQDMEKRTAELARKMAAENPGKTLLFVTHQGNIIYLLKALRGLNLAETVGMFGREDFNLGVYSRPVSIWIDCQTGKQADLHKQFVDEISWDCGCGGVCRREPEVLDCWFESGSMPYGQEHYPFSFKKNENSALVPADFIAEGIDQTRGWFYAMMVLSSALFKKEAAKNIIANGIVLAEDGKKMAKRLNNYPDPMNIMNKYGSDSLRYYLCASPVMKSDDMNFSEKDLAEQSRFLNVLLNALSFYKIFAQGGDNGVFSEKDLANILDKWIISRLEQTKQAVSEKMDNYNLHAIREIPVFINDLSTWYVRRSRERFKGDDQEDKKSALKILRLVLNDLAKIMAPFMPFIAEHIYQELKIDSGAESAHLEIWPEARQDLIDEKVLAEMDMARKIVELGLAKRDEAGIKVRQMLNKLRIAGCELRIEYKNLIADELNIKEVIAEKGDGELKVELDTEITDDLKLEGLKREIVRTVNNMRKNSGLTIKDRIILLWQSDSEAIKKVFTEMADELRKDVLGEKIIEKETEAAEIDLNGEKIKFVIKKM